MGMSFVWQVICQEPKFQHWPNDGSRRKVSEALCGPWNVMAIHQMAVEIFHLDQSGETTDWHVRMAKNITFVTRMVTSKMEIVKHLLRSHHFITLQEKHGSTGWDGGNPAVWQVDRLTSRIPVEFLSIAVPWSGSGKSRKTPSPPCYLITATSHTGTLCTLCSSAAKYKTTGKDAVYIIRLLLLFSMWNLG